ncbi:serine hydrolase domain-containing protein [Paenibacillus apiarius]|uniref:Beta-lactamase family protein n=1 Tax=Paenibacillus apiarius TaxID=46240 RepID=A0ABT4E0Y1_9BACL|nr:serine hydrolase domain-containing protein [Paenibacillus apiarius]MCY9517024.1 beta-lactamase family protein [Paenibacillus apiarius]MCY9523268.1 beta-lactamase family protein [Paenibacillus apiarius]MCY9554234.1 beta-lactamase family protein [Paenibacillus apiarius]MCY9560845.1 beta-lactamase family protein [Paenibacillus apiarius]MCY9682766.1 beta-lactamase family protein [Paenibacillus apiarius]
MRKEFLKREIEKKLGGEVASDLKLHNVYLLIHSEKLDIHWPMAAGKTDGVLANPMQPYHTASVGKTFTSVMLAILVEKGLVKFDDPISNYLPEDIVKDLHIYKGKEYTYDIQIKHLLSNTSGLPDYFEDKPKRGKGLMEEILANPSRFWTPQETIHWSKAHLQPRFPPGKGVHYTDTGYNLLGIIIETITSKPYHEVLHDYIFNPLHMNYSYLSQYSEPAIKSEHPVAHVYMDELKINVDDYRSFSSFYSGGQTVCTLEDLLLFMKALVKNQIIQKETLDMMKQWNKMWVGMDYGYGLMRMRFQPFSQRYLGWGHLGASGTSMLYFPNMDVYIIGSFNQTAYRSKGMNFIFFNVLRKLAKCAD